ncbi:hypothetical protein PFISCL1PPCAC_21594, partial [Pristionchus fissidentatus]
FVLIVLYYRYTTGGLAFFLNFFFLFLIIFKSPPSLTPYKIFLANSAITDLVFSMSTTFLQCRLIPNKWAFAYISLGPARFFGEQVSYYSYVLQLHSLFYLFLCFPLSFGFRYWILVRPMPTMKQIMQLLLCVWLLPLAQLICFVNSQSDSNAIREYLKENKPQYNLTGYVITGNHMLWQPLTPITLASIVLPMFPIYVVVIYFHRKVHQFLDRRDSGLALTIQASLPLFFVFPPITVYLLYHLEFIEFTIVEYLVYTLFSCMPVASPCVSIYFIRPYYMWIMRQRNKMLRIPPPEGSTNVGGPK